MELEVVGKMLKKQIRFKLASESAECYTLELRVYPAYK